MQTGNDQHHADGAWSPRGDAQVSDRRSRTPRSGGKRRRDSEACQIQPAVNGHRPPGPSAAVSTRATSSSHRSSGGSEYTASFSVDSRSDAEKEPAEVIPDATTTKLSADSNKDEIVHFSWHKGMVLHQRYELKKIFGDGTFGRVMLAWDTKEQRQVAVKIIRDVKRYLENAKIEADILRDIREVDTNCTSRCVILNDVFIHDERHLCLVCEPLGASLYEFLKSNGFRGFWLQDLQSFALQALQGLAFLHMKLSMTHTDLKPENVLLCTMAPPRPAEFPRAQLGRSSSSRPERYSQYMRPASTEIKLIDFGNATYDDEHHSSIINTRQYRSPEVVLGLGWDERSDIWSLGCILMELYTGELLFATHENLEHLALMERIVSPLPSDMLGRAASSLKKQYLASEAEGKGWRLHWPEYASSGSSERHVRAAKPLHAQVMPHHTLLADLIQHMLTVVPHRRPSALEAMKHPFFAACFDD